MSKDLHFNVLKTFLEKFNFPILDILIRDGYLTFSVETSVNDYQPVADHGVLELSFPDRINFVYYPNIMVTFKDGRRHIRFCYEIEKVNEYVNLLSKFYK